MVFPPLRKGANDYIQSLDGRDSLAVDVQAESGWNPGDRHSLVGSIDALEPRVILRSLDEMAHTKKKRRERKLKGFRESKRKFEARFGPGHVSWSVTTPVPSK